MLEYSGAVVASLRNRVFESLLNRLLHVLQALCPDLAEPLALFWRFSGDGGKRPSTLTYLVEPHREQISCRRRVDYLNHRRSFDCTLIS